MPSGEPDDRERWNVRYADFEPPGDLRPPGALVEAAGHLPGSGRALDLAGGAGDGALWLARRGLDTTLVEVSDVALGHARARAERLGLALATLRLDLERHRPEPGWDLVAVFHYLNRGLLADLASLVHPGGVIVAGIGTTTNLERHPRPSARFLVAPGELPTLLGEVDVIDHREDWSAWGIHEARVVARVPG